MPRGHFLFDVNTPRPFETIGATHWMDTPQVKLVLRSALEHDRSIARVDLEWFVPRGNLFEHAARASCTCGGPTPIRASCGAQDCASCAN